MKFDKLPPKKSTGKVRYWFLWGFFVLITLGGFSLVGSFLGYNQATTINKRQAAIESASALIQQYQLGVRDLQQKNYDLARQRFEYILSQDPGYPGAVDGIQTAIAVAYITATPTSLPPTATTTSTPDLRPRDETFENILVLFSDQEWTRVIDSIAALRKNDPGYKAAILDGLLFESFRNRGLIKIQIEGNLEGGIYDFSLAERFGPLDVEAQSWRNLARLYMYGSSFWEVYPERAIEYFSQVAAAAPMLRDASGWTAFQRYWAVIMQYGDKLSLAGDWCGANEQYLTALGMRMDQSVQVTQVYLANQCYTPTPGVTKTQTSTMTITPTQQITFPVTPTSTLAFTESSSPTATLPNPVSTSTDTPTVEPTATPTTAIEPTLTPTPTPSDTPVNTSEGS